MRRFAALAAAVLSAFFGLFVLIAPTAFAKPACFCQCAQDYDPIPRWADYTQGNPDCRNDCAQACDGAENLPSSTSTGKLYSNVACVPGQSSDCKSGAFFLYEGVTCALEFGPASQRAQDLQNFPDTDGKKPTCVVPITIHNANIECANFGGLGAGATCGEIQGGTDPNTYDKSRPLFGGPASSANKYNGTYSYQQWQALFQPIPAYDSLPATAGVCQRYGLLHGAGQTYDQGNNAGDQSVDQTFVQDAAPVNDMVCLKRKVNQCGHVDRPSQPNATVPLNGNAYSCQSTADLAARGLDPSTLCWGDHNSLCGASTDPNSMCCLGGSQGTGQCFTNSDCGPGKMCNSSGNCVVNVVCDPNGVDRRCRNATDQEKYNPNICTLPVLSSSPANCPVSGQYCCKAPNPAALSSCASDLLAVSNNDPRFNNFACLPSSELSSQLDPQTGTVKTFSPDAGLSVSGDSSWKNYDPKGPGPYCLGGTMTKYDQYGHVIGTVARCGTTSYCCDSSVINSPSQKAEQASQKQLGQACGTADNQSKGFTCLDDNVVLPSEADAVSKFGMSRDAYLTNLASSGNCQITPYDGNNLYATRECEPTTFCCSPKVKSAINCSSDDDCKGVPGTRCELSVHACLDENIVNGAQSSSSCYTAATSESNGAVDTFNAIIKNNKDSGGGTLTKNDFSCQLVDNTTPGVSDKCVPQGCKNSPVPAGEPRGTSSQCCIPGVGRSSGTAAQHNATSTQVVPYSLWLPSCIKSGDCTLNDVVHTGTAFANFLISISGAVFLAIFVYGGFLYLTAGTSDRAEKGKKMIIQATKGMVLLMSAFVLVNFIQHSLIAGSSGGKSDDACVAKSTAKVTYACRFLAAPASDAQAISQEISTNGCTRGLCGASAPNNYACCPVQ